MHLAVFRDPIPEVINGKYSGKTISGSQPSFWIGFHLGKLWLATPWALRKASRISIPAYANPGFGTDRAKRQLLDSRGKTLQQICWTLNDLFELKLRVTLNVLSAVMGFREQIRLLLSRWNELKGSSSNSGKICNSNDYWSTSRRLACNRVQSSIPCIRNADTPVYFVGISWTQSLKCLPFFSPALY